MLQLFSFLLLDLILIGALILVGLALGFFILTYFIMLVYAGMNPWVHKVKRKNWCCNPAFDIWYFEHNRRKWVAANFGGSTIFAIIFWLLFMLWLSFSYLSLFGDFIFYTNLFITLILGIVILIPIGYGIVHLHSP